MRNEICLASVFALVAAHSLQPAPGARDPAGYSMLGFEENCGQAEPSVLFLSRFGRWVTLYFESDSIRIAALDGEGKHSAITFTFPGAKASELAGEGRAGESHYVRGSDPAGWVRHVRRFSALRYRELYPGIDLVFHGSDAGDLEYTFFIAPNADPGRIAIEIKEASMPRVDASGAVTIADVLKAGALSAYQEREGKRAVVAARQVVDRRHRIRVAVGPYDRREALVIDPILTFSTFVGGTDKDDARALALDHEGNAYLTGCTYSSDFPASGAAFQDAFAGQEDAYIAKFDPTGTLVYSTFLGGVNDEFAESIAVDSNGSARVTGATTSADFPTRNAFQTVLHGTPGNGGTCDVFVSRLTPAGDDLVFSTYLGGNDEERGYGIATDDAGCTYITGMTLSFDFPMVNAVQSTFATGFVAKLDAAGTPVYSTYLGGALPSVSSGFAIASDKSGSAYVAGETNAGDFPLVRPFQPAFAGGHDGFIAVLDATGSNLLLSSYLGGEDSEFAQGIAVDCRGNGYLTGVTESADFPTVRALQPGLNGLNDGFVTKIDMNASAIIYSTYLGGTGVDNLVCVAVDPWENVYLGGRTYSTDYPLEQPVQTSLLGESSAVVTVLDREGARVLFSTYLGGSDLDGASGIAADGSGGLAVGGVTLSADFPVVRAFQPTGGGAGDAFVSRFERIEINGLRVGAVGNTLMVTHDLAALNISLTWQDIALGEDYVVRQSMVETGPFPTVVGNAPKGWPGLTLPMPAGEQLFFRVAARTCDFEGPP